MLEFTVLVEAPGENGDDWQPLAPPETATGDSAVEVARWTASNQDHLEGTWRVRVWDGPEADTDTEPAAEVYGNAL